MEPTLQQKARARTILIQLVNEADAKMTAGKMQSPVGAHQLYAALKKDGMEFPKGWIEFKEWLVACGTPHVARRLKREGKPVAL